MPSVLGLEAGANKRTSMTLKFLLLVMNIWNPLGLTDLMPLMIAFDTLLNFKLCNAFGEHVNGVLNKMEKIYQVID